MTDKHGRSPEPNPVSHVATDSQHIPKPKRAATRDKPIPANQKPDCSTES